MVNDWHQGKVRIDNFTRLNAGASIGDRVRVRTLDEEIEANVALAKGRIEEIAQNLKMSGIQATTKVVVGQPAEVIRSEAEKEDVSLIAISSQGASAIKKGRIGSTAYDVANSASRPVLILRQEKMAAY